MKGEDKPMASINTTVSFELYDTDKVPASADLYYNIDDGQTIAQLVTEAQALASAADPMLDDGFGQIHVTLHFDSTITRAPRAGAQTELTGLQSFDIVGVPSRTYGLDLPGARASKFIGGLVPTTDTDEIAWLAALLTPPTGWVATNNSYQELNAEVNQMSKTFRKKRKALNRKKHTVA